MTRLGRRVYQDQPSSGSIPRGSPTSGSAGRRRPAWRSREPDFHAVVNRRIAITPIHLDLTGRRLLALERLRTWDWPVPYGRRWRTDGTVAADPAAANEEREQLEESSEERR